MSWESLPAAAVEHTTYTYYGHDTTFATNYGDTTDDMGTAATYGDDLETTFATTYGHDTTVATNYDDTTDDIGTAADANW